MYNEDLVSRFVRTFVNFYGLKETKNYIFDSDCVFVTGIWDDDEEEDFFWIIIFMQNELNNLIELMDYIQKNKLYKNDKILISDDNLCDVFVSKGWDKQLFNHTNENLYKIEFPRIEENEIVDYFYVHQ